MKGQKASCLTKNTKSTLKKQRGKFKMFDDTMLDMQFPSITGQSETVREAMARMSRPKSSLYFKKGMDYTAFNDLVEQEVSEFIQAYNLDDDNETRRGIIALLQNVGVKFDGCSSCGRMPMEPNCNNARCQD